MKKLKINFKIRANKKLKQAQQINKKKRRRNNKMNLTRRKMNKELS